MRIHWIGLLCLVGCEAEPEIVPHRPIEGIDELSQPLSDLTAQCVFTASAHSIALTLNGGDIAVVARAPDGALTVNGFACGAATAIAVRRIDVTEGTSGDQSLILDYGGGVFGAGLAGAPGVVIDLGNETVGDSLKLAGTTGTDRFVFGAAGITINSDSYLDIVVTHVEDFVISLDNGDDSFSGAGNAVTGAAFAQAVTVYGGSGADALRGGDGDDTLDGGDGNDSFTTGASSDGNDALRGGLGTDTADYSTRIAAVTITMDGAADDGALGETDNVAADVEILKGGMGDDHLTGSINSDTISRSVFLQPSSLCFSTNLNGRS